MNEYLNIFLILELNKVTPRMYWSKNRQDRLILEA